MSTEEITINEFRIEDIPLSCTWIIVGPPGSGKCLAPGTPIVMYDGTIKNVEDVKECDLLLGDDSTPRTVLSTTKGTDKMYRIKQTRGEDYTVNEPHILVLYRDGAPIISHSIGVDTPYYEIVWVLNGVEFTKQFHYSNLEEMEYASKDADEFFYNMKSGESYTKDNYIEISVKDFMELDEAKRIKYKGVRTIAQFNSSGVLFDPWVIGRCIGDENEYDKMLNIVSEFQNSKGSGIPLKYKTSSYEERISLLAGIIDSKSGKVVDDDYKIYQENDTYVNDILFIARSCGIYATVSKIRKINDGKIQKYVNEITLHNDESLEKISNICLLKKITKFKTNSLLSDITIEPLGEGTYYGFQIDGNKRFLLGDFTITHNTSLIENLCYYHKHKYPVARMFIGTESGYQKFSDIFHPLYVSNYYDEEQEISHIKRQRTCVMENSKGYTGNYAINILDDVSDDPKIYKTKVMKGIFKLGSQHWEQLFLLGSQYAIDMPPDIRKATSYVAIFREPEELERKKLYQNFGGLAGSYQNFCDLMDQITGNHTCLIFKKRSQSNKLEDCIFYFQTKILGKWKFGCNEYRQWGDSRYNVNYVEKIMM